MKTEVLWCTAFGVRAENIFWKDIQQGLHIYMVVIGRECSEFIASQDGKGIECV